MDLVEYFKDMLMKYPVEFALNRLKCARFVYVIVEINASKYNGNFFEKEEEIKHGLKEKK